MLILVSRRQGLLEFEKPPPIWSADLDGGWIWIGMRIPENAESGTPDAGDVDGAGWEQLGADTGEYADYEWYGPLPVVEPQFDDLPPPRKQPRKPRRVPKPRPADDGDDDVGEPLADGELPHGLTGGELAAWKKAGISDDVCAQAQLPGRTGRRFAAALRHTLADHDGVTRLHPDETKMANALARKHAQLKPRAGAEGFFPRWDGWPTPCPAGSSTGAGWDTVMETLGVEWRRNIRAGRYEVRVEDTGCPWSDWRRVDDFVEARVRDAGREVGWYLGGLGELRDWQPSRADWSRLRDSCVVEYLVDPFLVWLDGLPEWDGVPRLDGLLGAVFSGVEDSEFAAWVSRFAMLGCVQRAREPGCELREMPVLIGDQLAGKSTFFARMFPAGYEMEWFGDGLELDARGKEKAEAMQGRVLVEIGELTGMGKADRERLKAFLSRRNDGQHRAAYAHHPADHPRSCVLVGTTNDRACLPPDQTGNTRFVPLEVGVAYGRTDEALERIGVEQLWAEAVWRYEDGERANMPYEWKDAAASRAAVFRYRNEAAVLVVDSLEAEWISCADLRNQTGEAPYHAVVNELRDRGWTSKSKRSADRFEDRKVRGWEPPAEADVLTVLPLLHGEEF
ncbi:MAG: hypothetical protein OXR67_11235 [Chloroflexota bacterium]|nr:hypothetical protein [Chloroflexota bacterium]